MSIWLEEDSREGKKLALLSFHILWEIQGPRTMSEWIVEVRIREGKKLAPCVISNFREDKALL